MVPDVLIINGDEESKIHPDMVEQRFLGPLYYPFNEATGLEMSRPTTVSVQWYVSDFPVSRRTKELT